MNDKITGLIASIESQLAELKGIVDASQTPGTEGDMETEAPVAGKAPLAEIVPPAEEIEDEGEEMGEEMSEGKPGACPMCGKAECPGCGKKAKYGIKKAGGEVASALGL